MNSNQKNEMYYFRLTKPEKSCRQFYKRFLRQFAIYFYEKKYYEQNILQKLKREEESMIFSSNYLLNRIDKTKREIQKMKAAR